jgi:hypothetical protein
MLINLPSIESREDLLSRSWVIACGQTDGRTDGHDEADRRTFATFRGECTNNESFLFILLHVPREISSQRIGNLDCVLCCPVAQGEWSNTIGIFCARVVHVGAFVSSNCSSELFIVCYFEQCKQLPVEPTKHGLPYLVKGVYMISLVPTWNRTNSCHVKWQKMLVQRCKSSVQGYPVRISAGTPTVLVSFVFHSPSRQMPGQCFNVDSDRFLSYALEFIIHRHTLFRFCIISSSPRRPDALWGPPSLLSNGHRRWNWPLTSN